ncbi:MAG TPA: outer-membrane lipoprotein carrier protein LolA [Methylocystis sp.]|nr:outer-membrane lipoprotein carrier protein LolA [Methylocystis sp.]
MKHASFFALALSLSLLCARAAAAQQPAAPAAQPKAAAKAKPEIKKPVTAAKPELATTKPAATPTPAPEKAGPAEAPPLAPAKLDRAEILKRANAFFNASPVMIADFVQIGGDGAKAEGKLYLQRAGRMRFEYAAPATLEVVSDGAQVLIRDRKLKTQTLYFIDQTPLKFFMKEKTDLESDVKVESTAVEDSGVHVLLEDKTTFGGTSKIQLVFDQNSFKLKQWHVTDPQGNETQVSLYNIDQKTTPDPKLFNLDAAKND